MAALRVKDEVKAEDHDGEQAADEGAEETVAAILNRVLHIVAQTEDDADAGEGRVAPDEAVDDGHQHGRDGRFDVAPADVELEIGVRDAREHRVIPPQIFLTKDRIPQSWRSVQDS